MPRKSYESLLWTRVSPSSNTGGQRDSARRQTVSGHFSQRNGSVS